MNKFLDIILKILLLPFYPFIELFKFLFPHRKVERFATQEDCRRHSLYAIAEILDTIEPYPIAKQFIKIELWRMRRNMNAHYLNIDEEDDDWLTPRPAPQVEIELSAESPKDAPQDAPQDAPKTTAVAEVEQQASASSASEPAPVTDNPFCDMVHPLLAEKLRQKEEKKRA